LCGNTSKKSGRCAEKMKWQREMSGKRSEGRKGGNASRPKTSKKTTRRRNV